MKLKVQGMSIKEMHSNHLSHLSLRTLYVWNKSAVQNGNLAPKKASGRPLKLDNRDIRHIHRAVQQNPEFSIAQIAETAGVEVCNRTIMKTLSKFEIKSYVAVDAQLLTPSHVEKRLIYCTRHENSDLREWTRWTFSDECSVELDCSEGIQRFLITKSQRYEPQFINDNGRGVGVNS